MAEKAKTRDRWDKLDIILRFAGAIMTPLVLALFGFFGSRFLARQQEAETNLRLYTELISKREDADTSLRKEMLSSVIADFNKPLSKEKSEQPEQLVLNLELLAYNFSDSLDLGPLFKDVYKKLSKHPDQNRLYIDRLAKVTRDVVARQSEMLLEAGGKRDGSIEFAELDRKTAGVTVIDDLITVKSIEHPGEPPTQKQVRVEVLSRDSVKRELEVRLIVRTPPNTDETDAVFTVGFFDFPIYDNLRFAQGYHCAIVLNQFDTENGMADLTFLYFPISRASLKEKSSYDDFLYNLRKPSGQ